MSHPPKRRALGRGLSALLPQDEGSTPARAESAPPAKGAFAHAQIEEIRPSPEQPRRDFEDAALEELAQSIRACGVIQPLVVRPVEGGGYTLVAGERRWRAAQRAGLHEVPVVIQDFDPGEALERALVENIQRSDLNAIEEGEAYRRLVDDFGHTQEQVADRVGKDRATVANTLRLLKLPPRAREMVEAGTLSMGHARALLGMEDEDAIASAARKIAAEKLTVRAAERLVRDLRRPEQEGTAGRGAAGPGASGRDKSPAVRDVETRLERALGARVSLKERRKGGTIEIHYADLDDLDRLLGCLTGED